MRRASLSRPRRTLAVAGVAHALHDGYTDLIYVLLPVWQAKFALSYGVLALLRGLYAGAMAALQIPAGRLAERFGRRAILVLGTALSALGYALAGLSGGLLDFVLRWLCLAPAPARSIRSLRQLCRGPTGPRLVARWAPITSPAI